MASLLRKTVKITGYTAASLAGIVGVYLGVSWVLSRIPVAKKPSNEAETIPFFVYSNGVHTDLVMPVKTSLIDWSQQVRYANTLANDASLPYVGIGWGDKGFYLDTPTWADLKASTAFKAGFWLSSSAMHATFYAESELRPGPECVALHLSPAEYARLIAYIQASFRHDAAGNVELIPGHSYARTDAFYEAHRVYSVFYTCNTWANNALKISGQKACLWTPFDTGILHQYRDQTGR
ncbi:TIGR02117 family protein [Hymenobacter sp. HMF4947]|uniref:TIGR02117 family protein n=1 Tax=Hymenobacter ginkgonis TaxID=2682976 RepID=A0A7K1TG77_9BACT|nr:TIGR02117 family protein [Hymenobacter ginkgonis]MVN77171.1 TIGR02117 family protein [Hymenobacter ginkgonis]